MSNMQKELVPYELAVKLKVIGFDEPCMFVHDTWGNTKNWTEDGEGEHRNSHINASIYYSAPLFQQAFRWFRNNYSTYVEIHETTDWEEDNESWSFVIFKYRLGDNDGMISSTIDYKTYEEAELTCLIKLIEIVEQKK